jgi:uncharacterized protein RhaS with RHS repeats
MYMRNRYYDPATGQFTQTDPIGLAGGLNAYGFADGDPVSYDDPYGLCSTWAQKFATPMLCLRALVGFDSNFVGIPRAGEQDPINEVAGRESSVTREASAAETDGDVRSNRSPEHQPPRRVQQSRPAAAQVRSQVVRSPGRYGATRFIRAAARGGVVGLATESLTNPSEAVAAQPAYREREPQPVTLKARPLLVPTPPPGKPE